MKASTILVLAGAMGLAACENAAEPEADVNNSAVQIGTDEAEAPEGPEAPADAPETPAARADNAITCNWPAQQGDTAQDLEALFGDDARIQMVAGGEGTEIPGVVLWPDDPARQIEVIFADAARTQVTNVRVFNGSRWEVGGLSTGDTIAQATAANGKPFVLLGFEWDYGGAVFDLKGGALADLDGCRAMMSFGPSAETKLPNGLVGDIELMSDDDRMPVDGVTIWELGLVFPEE